MVTMPQTDGHHAARGVQSQALAGVIHERSTSPKIGALIAAVDEKCLEGKELANFRLMVKAYKESCVIPKDLERRKAQVSSDAYVAWTKAREASDFDLFSPLLGEAFSVAGEIASLRMDGEASVYDKMLDDFERGLPADRVQEIFDEVEAALPPLIERVLASPNSPDESPLSGSFPLPAQEGFNREIVSALGFKGRSDVSVHPFTTSFSPSDVRITTRFDEGEWYQGLAGSVHEAGHGMYEANLDGECRAVNSPLSMGTHESQSLFWERHVGMSRAFSKFMGPKWREAFGREESDEEIYRAVNTVKRSLIRVEADELTYPLHVILRTRIERDVVNGKVSVGDIPALWNSGMKAMLDVDVPEDSKGCLQDVHWSGLAIGYFPTYLIGAVAAAQLEHHARMELGNFDELIERGEFDAIQAWLRGKVHRHGSEHSSIDELFKEQLGEELKSSYFIKYLTDKYSSIYDL
jgi:Zn-dependent M32 family carboxypeptidase